MNLPVPPGMGGGGLRPAAQAIASRTEVFPWLFRPPITVRPFCVGVIAHARMRFTFSSSKLVILTGSDYRIHDASFLSS